MKTSSSAKKKLKSSELNKKIRGLTTIVDPPLILKKGYDSHTNSIDWCVTARTNPKEDISSPSQRKLKEYKKYQRLKNQVDYNNTTLQI